MESHESPEDVLREGQRRKSVNTIAEALGTDAEWVEENPVEAIEGTLSHLPDGEITSGEHHVLVLAAVHVLDRMPDDHPDYEALKTGVGQAMDRDVRDFP